jgi:hypothetical protein
MVSIIGVALSHVAIKMIHLSKRFAAELADLFSFVG